MTDIRYVCVSDMHLGEEDSLLTNLKPASTDTDPTEPSPVLRQLVECLRYLISKNKSKRKPTLILNGDILELALTTTNEAAMVFERFVELVLPARGRLFDEIIYVPGNHDHHLWEGCRETQYVDYIATLEPGKPLPIPWHATNMFARDDAPRVHAYFLSRLVRRYEHLGEKDFEISVAYPNLGLLGDDGRKCVVFHHGHFIESLYRLMSTLKTLVFPDRAVPRHVWDLQAENFAWIDFFWSSMGRSGQVGRDMELVYEKMQDPEQLKKLLATLATSLAERYDLPGWGDRMEASLLRGLFNTIVDRFARSERALTDRVLSKDAENGLWAYMKGPLRNQLDLELKGNMPADVTFVFGHTHKPFQEDMNFTGYPKWVNVYNTGGWVVESVDPETRHGGAVILIDEKLDVTSLRLYNEAEDPTLYSVGVEEATHTGEEASPFHRRIVDLIDPSAEPWQTFSTLVARAVRVRAQNLRARINERDTS
jgi:UDP-2,3-diacylglucosamine pyrophosphatase LpxH